MILIVHEQVIICLFKLAWKKQSFFTEQTNFSKYFETNFVLKKKQYNFTEQMIFTNNFLKNDSFFYKKNDFIERTNLLNERFYWINGFTEGLFGEITNKIDLINER